MHTVRTKINENATFLFTTFVKHQIHNMEGHLGATAAWCFQQMCSVQEFNNVFYVFVAKIGFVRS